MTAIENNGYLQKAGQLSVVTFNSFNTILANRLIIAVRNIYTLLIYLLMPVILLRLWWRGHRNPAYRERIGERFGYLPVDVPQGCLWIHAVSVGESQATQPMVQWLMEAHPGMSVVMTTTTPTGGQRVAQLYGERIRHLYFPYDSPAIMQRYFEALKPVAVIIMETEVWPNMLHYCRQKSIPVALANARLSEKSAQGYHKFSFLTAAAFRCFDLVIAQAEADAKRLIKSGVRKEVMHVCGSIKFEVKVPQSVREQGELLRAALGADRPVWIAASTHENEETVVLDAHRQVLEHYPDALLIIVPRHPERFDTVAGLIESSGHTCVRRTDEQLPVTEVSVYLGDVMGELPIFYGAADVAFVGGSISPIGGHNILEPAALGVAVVFGPHMQNFLEISRMMLEAGAALQTDEARLAEVVLSLLGDPVQREEIGQHGQEVVESNQGALECTRQAIEHLLEMRS
jgi:3-deoxy-D-manno-octulosonic-acid transferase